MVEIRRFLLSGTVLLIAAALVGALSSLVRTRFVAVGAGPENFGVYSVLVAWLGVLVTAGSLNLGAVATKAICAASSPAEVSSAVSEVMTVGVILSIGIPVSLLPLLFVLLPTISVEIDYYPLIAISVGSGIIYYFVSSVTLALGKTVAYVALQLIAVLISLLAVVIAYALELPGLNIVAACALPLAGLASTVIIWKRALIKFSWVWSGGIRFLRSWIGSALRHATANIFQQGLVALGRFSLILLLPTRDSGLLLSAWMAAYSVISLFVVAISKDLLPSLARARANGDEDFSNALGAKTRIFFTILVVAGSGLAISQGLVIQVLYGREFAQAAQYLTLFVLVELIRSFATFVGVGSVAVNNEKTLLAAEIFAFSLTLVLFMVLRAAGFTPLAVLAVALGAGSVCSVFVQTKCLHADIKLTLRWLATVILIILAICLQWSVPSYVVVLSLALVCLVMWRTAIARRF